MTSNRPLEGTSDSWNEGKLSSPDIMAVIRTGFIVLLSFFPASFFVVHRVGNVILGFQIGMLGLLIVNTSLYYRHLRKGSTNRYLPFIVSIADIAGISLFFATFNRADLPWEIIFTAFLSSLFTLIIFFFLYERRKSLTVTLGVFGIVALYVVIFYGTRSDQAISVSALYYTAPSVLFLVLTVAMFCTVSSKLKRYKSKIFHSHGLLRDAGKVLPAILFKIDKEGKFVWAEVVAPRNFGIDSEEMVGRNIRHFIASGEFKTDDVPVAEVFEARNFNPNVKYIDCIINGDKSHTIYDGCILDVTQRHLQVTAKQQEMERRLFQFQKMESLGTLASGMAHDFSHIIHSVTDLSEQVCTITQEHETRKKVEEIVNSLTDARLLIGELQALGQNKPLNYAYINMGNFLHNLLPRYTAQLGAAYKVNLSIGDEEIYIRGDVEYLKRVFQNLVNNAKDAMPSGGTVTFELFTVQINENEENVVVRVADTGSGIAPSVADKIFNPFVTTKEKGRGTGLGLALVRRIIAQHKGTIGIERSGAGGTTFRIEIPRSRKNADDVDTKLVMINRKSSHIIILDDDVKMRKIITFYLSDFSYTTHEAATLEEGLGYLQRYLTQCNLLIMDWKLAGCQPHEVVHAFRRMKPDLTIMVVSGYQPDAIAMQQLDISRWLTKPYDKNRLDLEIQKALYGKKINA